MSSPSDKAISEACCAGGSRAGSWTHYTNGIVRAGLEAAHDPALGLDRSVCLRDVVEVLRGWTMDGSGYPSDLIEREFACSAQNQTPERRTDG
jgi:hypothetical protein